MDNQLVKYYQSIGEINKIIASAKTIDEALKESLKVIIGACKVTYATIWYKDDKDVLHPNHFICPLDFSNVEIKDDQKNTIRNVYDTQTAVRKLDYSKQKDSFVETIYKGLEISSYICVPISNNLGKVGCIDFMKESGVFTEDEANLLEMLSMMAMMQISDSEKFDQSWKERNVILSAKEITKDFKNGEFITKVLKGVNLDVYEGEFLVLLGESGCGKSTLLNILSGMDNATSGALSFKDSDITRFNQDQLTKYRRDNIGFIFQSYNLMPNLNVKQNLDLIGELVKDPIPSMDLLKLVGLEDKAKNYPNQLSGGQQQRVSIARSLVKRPAIIMADEPTAALDYETSIEVLSALADVHDKGTTLVMVTHNEEIAKMANRVVRMRNGKIYQITVNRRPLKASELVW